MNKTALRNFAVWSRCKLIDQIADRAMMLGVTEDGAAQIQAKTNTGFMINGITYNYPLSSRDAFIAAIRENGYQNVIEEIAYTWFNRIVAIRFMEVNGYLENGTGGETICVIGSTEAGRNEPDAVFNAAKLKYTDKDKVYSLQDRSDTEGLFRYILTLQCNELSKWMPQVFEIVNDYTEMLLPEGLLLPDGVVDHLVNDLHADDFDISGDANGQVEIFGWLYQFYISQKKDEVFASDAKISKSTLPAVTQLFTPDWIVRYLTDNTLGKIWIESRPQSSLTGDLKYYLKPEKQSAEAEEKQKAINAEYAGKSVTDIRFIDPCCGSGHMLVYAFDLFYKMYLEEGYYPEMIPNLILKNNLVGIDIDKRAIQLTSFALTMKARSYNRNLFTEGYCYPKALDIRESNLITDDKLAEFLQVFALDTREKNILKEVVFRFRDAELFGSLIKNFEFSPRDYMEAAAALSSKVSAASLNIMELVVTQTVYPLMMALLLQAEVMSDKYSCVATNPPYMNPGSCGDIMAKYAATNYPDSKTDMFAMFIERCGDYMTHNGYQGMITMHSWMFLSSYEKLRAKLINTKEIVNMAHLGARAFEDIGGEVVQTTAWVMRNK